MARRCLALGVVAMAAVSTHGAIADELEPIGHGARFAAQPKASSGGLHRKSLFAHPPWKDGVVGWVVGRFEVDLRKTKDPALAFDMGIRDDHGSPKGLLFRVRVDGRRVFYEFHKDAVWQAERVPLKPFAGKQVTIELGVYSLGEHYALWGRPRIVDNRQGNADEIILDLVDKASQAQTGILPQKRIAHAELPDSYRHQQAEARRELVDVRPSPQQLAWQKLEYIGFAHFGINTFTNREWGTGKEDPRSFNPTAFDAGQWVRVLKDAGIKLLIVTAKHHDGFCLWPSKYTEHSVKNSPWKDGKGDIVGEIATACREGGMLFGFYLSPWDRNHPSYGDSPTYNAYFKNQLRELLTNYGKVTEVWFDGACGEGPNGKKQVYDWQGYYQVVRELQPDALIAISGPDIRWVGNESGVARETEWSVQPANPRMHPGKKVVWWPAECDVSIRPGWFYHADQDNKVKSLEHLLDIYYKSIGRNSVLLLNIPPDRRGLIHENDARRLTELRRVLDETFKTNLATGKSAQADGADGTEHVAAKTVDGDADTYYAPAKGKTTATIEVRLGRPEAFNRSMIQEHVALGQRVEGYGVDVWDGSGWREIAKGTTVGYKKLDRFDEVTTDRVRIRITASRAEPLIQEIGLFRAPPIDE